MSHWLTLPLEKVPLLQPDHVLQYRSYLYTTEASNESIVRFQSNLYVRFPISYALLRNSDGEIQVGRRAGRGCRERYFAVDQGGAQAFEDRQHSRRDVGRSRGRRVGKPLATCVILVTVLVCVGCLFLRSPSRVPYRTQLLPRAPKGRRTRTPHP
jgi:hypothetical protein